MAKLNSAEVAVGRVKVAVRNTKTKTGKTTTRMHLQLPPAIAKKGRIRKDSVYEAYVAENGAIMLVPLDQGGQVISKERRNEILSALEKTHRQFGNTLRRLAE
jgi:hypothetical protein